MNAYERQSIFLLNQLLVFNKRIEVLWPYSELLRLSHQMPQQDVELTAIKFASHSAKTAIDLFALE
jgi:hypothetical protein